MLAIETEFPQVGSKAFLRPSGAECRIVRRNPDSTALISLAEKPRDASGNTTVSLDQLAATAAEAWPAPKRRGKRR